MGCRGVGRGRLGSGCREGGWVGVSWGSGWGVGVWGWVSGGRSGVVVSGGGIRVGVRVGVSGVGVSGRRGLVSGGRCSSVGRGGSGVGASRGCSQCWVSGGMASRGLGDPGRGSWCREGCWGVGGREVGSRVGVSGPGRSSGGGSGVRVSRYRRVGGRVLRCREGVCGRGFRGEGFGVSGSEVEVSRGFRLGCREGGMRLRCRLGWVRVWGVGYRGGSWVVTSRRWVRCRVSVSVSWGIEKVVSRGGVWGWGVMRFGVSGGLELQYWGRVVRRVGINVRLSGGYGIEGARCQKRGSEVEVSGRGGSGCREGGSGVGCRDWRVVGRGIGKVGLVLGCREGAVWGRGVGGMGSVSGGMA